MAITAAVPNQAKLDFLQGVHASADVYKAVAIKTGHAGTYDKNTVAAGTPGAGAPTVNNVGTDECAASGSYTSGGVALGAPSFALNGDEASMDFANLNLTTFTGSIDGIAVVNTSKTNKIVAVLPMANAPVAATNGTVAITIPTSGNGVVRWT